MNCRFVNLQKGQEIHSQKNKTCDSDQNYLANFKIWKSNLNCNHLHSKYMLINI